MLDAGIGILQTPLIICISHIHCDHIEKLTSILININSKPIFFVPNGMKQKVFDYVNSFFRLAVMDDNYIVDINIIECGDSDVHVCKINGIKLKIKMFKTYHRINSVEYSFYKIREKIKKRIYNKIA